MSTGKETLARPRPALPGDTVRSVWKEEHGCWVCYHRDRSGLEWSEMLPVHDSEDTLSAAIAELRSCNVCSPLLAASSSECNGSPRVFPDKESGYWTAWIPCTYCGGFPLQLHMTIGSVNHEELEGETARLLAHRMLFVHGQTRDPRFCAGCRAEEIASGSRRSGVWLSLEEQIWYLRIEEGPLLLDIPLDLPAWTAPSALRERVSAIKARPYNWEQDGQ